jgi:hypothetical protein
MTLPAGTRLGPYEILAPLGAGGMGTAPASTIGFVQRDPLPELLGGDS